MGRREREVEARVERIGTISGVIQRDQAERSRHRRSRPPRSSSRTAQARCARSSSRLVSPSARVASSTAPPGNTHTPGMKRASVLRCSEQDLEPALGLLPAAPQEDHRCAAVGGSSGSARTGNLLAPALRHLIAAVQTADRDRAALDVHVLRVHLRPRRRRSRRRNPTGNRRSRTSPTLVLPRVRRPQGGLRALRGVAAVPAAARRVIIVPGPLAAIANGPRVNELGRVRGGRSVPVGPGPRAKAGRGAGANRVRGALADPTGAGFRTARGQGGST